MAFNFSNELNLDEEGNLYFTDSNIYYQRRSVMPCPLLCFGALLSHFHITVLVGCMAEHFISTGAMLLVIGWLSRPELLLSYKTTRKL